MNLFDGYYALRKSTWAYTIVATILVQNASNIMQGGVHKLLMLTKFCQLLTTYPPTVNIYKSIPLMYNKGKSVISSTTLLLIRCLMVSTNQADASCFYFRISWILMEQRWLNFFHPLHFLQGLRSLKHWLLQKLSMKIFDQKFRFLIKK